MERCYFYGFGYLFHLFQLIGNCLLSVQINKSILTLVNSGRTFTIFSEKNKYYVVRGYSFCGYFMCLTYDGFC
jgi:hypothetical protein